ncbi:MAG: hypothetical protein K6D97_07265 [Clostridia bacterium]|nr:hypothetical protein [Clostridia bacterium]
MGELINEIYKILSGFIGLQLITINQYDNQYVTGITVNPKTGKRTFTICFSGTKEIVNVCLEELVRYNAENYQRVYSTRIWQNQIGNVTVAMMFIEQ